MLVEKIRYIDYNGKVRSWTINPKDTGEYVEAMKEADTISELSEVSVYLYKEKKWISWRKLT